MVYYSLNTQHAAHYTLHTTHCTLHTAHYAPRTLRTLHAAQYTTHYTLHTKHYTLHTTHYTTRHNTQHTTLHTTQYNILLTLSLDKPTAVDTRQCTVVFEGGQSVCRTKAGAEVKATIQARDKYGNRVTVGGLSPSFEASVHVAPERWNPASWRRAMNALNATTPVGCLNSVVYVNPTDNKDGTYTVTFCLSSVGEFLFVRNYLPSLLTSFFFSFYLTLFL